MRIVYFIFNICTFGVLFSLSSCSTDQVGQEIMNNLKPTTTSNSGTSNNVTGEGNQQTETETPSFEDNQLAIVNHIGNGKVSIESEGQNLIEVEILGESSVPASTNWGDGCQGHVNNKTFHKYDSPEKRNMVMDAPNSNGVKLSTLSGIMTIDLSDY